MNSIEDFNKLPTPDAGLPNLLSATGYAIMHEQQSQADVLKKIDSHFSHRIELLIELLRRIRDEI